jgi:anionic cell wall polymer biosynthesis LytR-Cps2A-Psr (LCP) family protein
VLPLFKFQNNFLESIFGCFLSNNGQYELEKVVVHLRKLCIAVIVLSFIGFGPLKSFFHGDKGIQTLKHSSRFFNNQQNVKSFLITEVSSANKNPRAAMLLKYDDGKNKLMAAQMMLPEVGKGDSINGIKKAAEDNYHITIDHCFIFDPTGIARIIDLLAPNGITINLRNADLPQLQTNNHPLKGKELILFMEQGNKNPNNQDELNAVFSGLKKEIAKNQSPEKWVTIAPTIINEAFKSVNTDLGKGQLMALGITALLNPIVTIEPMQLAQEGIYHHAGDSPLEKAN